MKKPVKKPDKPDYVKVIREASKYTQDILLGRKTAAEVLDVPEGTAEELFLRARTAFVLEDYKNAAELFQALLFLDSRDQRAALGMAGALEGLEEFALAAIAYTSLILPNYMDPVPPFRAGTCLMKLGKKKEALDLFRLAADCGKAGLPPGKKAYAEKAAGMVRALSNE